MIDEFFGECGPLARLRPGYQVREGQVIASETIYQAMTERRMALVEAPTGTGKSIAYLVPAFLEAIAGRRVVISTHTKSLQEQLVHKDIPLMQKLFAGANVNVALLKGRGNYLCQHEYSETDADPLRRQDRDWKRLTSAVYGGKWDGDAGSLDFVYPHWQDVSSTKDSCTGKKCRHYHSCFYYQSRQRAKKAGIIIVNHALALQDAVMKQEGMPGLLPPYTHVVFDEAHHLTEVADSCVGIEWTVGRIRHLVKRLGKLLIQIAAAEELAFVSQCNEAIFEQFATMKSQAMELSRSLDVNRAHAVYTSWHGMEEALTLFTERLALELPQEEDEVTADGQKLVAVSRTLDRFLTEAAKVMDHIGEDDLVRYVERDNNQRVAIKATHVDPAALLAEVLWKPMRDKGGSACFVSATLATDKGFGYPKSQMGLTGYASLTAQVESPFDFKTNALLYVPSHLPDPPDRKGKTIMAYDQECAAYSAAQTAEMLKLCHLTQGRAFLLFTSWTALKQAQDAFAGQGFELFVQKENSHRQILHNFVQSERGVLLGVASFWEGVDVQGEDLSLVVIDKLPFATHDHPLKAAREKAHRKAGGNPFVDLTIPEAQIKLKQGFGRLIRTVTDRGIVAILDTRLHSKPYGKRFLNSLPPARKASLWKGVEAFWNEPAQFCATSELALV
jgi:ATP-dependent DNA helicase DinG